MDGSGARRLGSGAVPQVSPDGRWVVFRREADVYVMSISGGRTWLLAREAFPVAWSPTSRHVAASGEQSLYVMDVETRRRVTVDRGATTYGASFSPSGEEIVWARKRGQGYLVESKVDLFRARVDGSAMTRLTRDGKSAVPVWGPALIAFSRIRPGTSRHFPTYGLSTLRARGDGLRRLTRHSLLPFEWSADGRRLLAVASRRAGLILHAVDPEAGSTRALVQGGHVYAGGLSRDGRFVLAWVRGNLVRVSWDSGARKILARNVHELADWNL